MKKKVLALLLGGVLTVGGLALQTPLAAQAALVEFEECEDSSSHIHSSQVTTANGQLTVTIDLDFETKNGQFFLYVFSEQLEKRTAGIFQFYDMDDDSRVAASEALKESDTYTFSDLSDDRAYYVYCRVEDNHKINDWGENKDPDEIFSHYAAYLGTNGFSGNSSDGSSSGSIRRRQGIRVDGL